MVNAQSINEHMEVIGSDGAHVGTVDYLEGSDKIKLTKSDPKSGGQHTCGNSRACTLSTRIPVRKTNGVPVLASSLATPRLLFGSAQIHIEYG